MDPKVHAIKYWCSKLQSVYSSPLIGKQPLRSLPHRQNYGPSKWMLWRLSKSTSWDRLVCVPSCLLGSFYFLPTRTIAGTTLTSKLFLVPKSVILFFPLDSLCWEFKIAASSSQAIGTCQVSLGIATTWDSEALHAEWGLYYDNDDDITNGIGRERKEKRGLAWAQIYDLQLPSMFQWPKSC